MKNTKRPGWSRLDNAAKVFPALANKKDSRVFRFACQLTEPVQKKALQQAAEQALEEFPIFTNIIRHGMFWYYLEESGEMPIVHEEDQNVCSRLYDKNEHHLLIDISYYKCRINFAQPRHSPIESIFLFFISSISIFFFPFSTHKYNYIFLEY